jgi:hypothetical protein
MYTEERKEWDIASAMHGEFAEVIERAVDIEKNARQMLSDTLRTVMQEMQYERTDKDPYHIIKTDKVEIANEENMQMSIRRMIGDARDLIMVLEKLQKNDTILISINKNELAEIGDMRQQGLVK